MSDTVTLKYYVLPLYDLSINMFKNEYISTYLNKEGTFIFLQLTEERKDGFNNNKYYSGNIPIDDKVFHVFETPEEFLIDMSYIISGKYKKLSNKAINKIIQLSGLTYMKRDPVRNVDIIAKPLMALVKPDAYRKHLEKTLDVKLSDKDEIWTALTKECFIENLIGTV